MKKMIIMMLLILSLVGCQSKEEPVETVKVFIKMPMYANVKPLYFETEAGKTLGEIVIPIKEPGYTFIRYEDLTNTPVDYKIVVYEDMTLNAIYEENTYQLVFHVNGGEPMAPVTFTYSDGDYLTPYVPTREGYVFKGWYTDETLRYPLYIFFAEEDDVHVYAKWELAE